MSSPPTAAAADGDELDMATSTSSCEAASLTTAMVPTRRTAGRTAAQRAGRRLRGPRSDVHDRAGQREERRRRGGITGSGEARRKRGARPTGVACYSYTWQRRRRGASVGEARPSGRGEAESIPHPRCLGWCGGTKATSELLEARRQGQRPFFSGRQLSGLGGKTNPRPGTVAAHSAAADRTGSQAGPAGAIGCRACGAGVPGGAGKAPWLLAATGLQGPGAATPAGDQRGLLAGTAPVRRRDHQALPGARSPAGRVLWGSLRQGTL